MIVHGIISLDQVKQWKLVLHSKWFFDLHHLGIGIEFIVSDNDSTMRAHLRWIGTEKNAKLPLNVYQPSFLCDPSHRIKVMVKDIFALALQSKSKSNAEKIDAMRVKNIADVG